MQRRWLIPTTLCLTMAAAGCSLTSASSGGKTEGATPGFNNKIPSSILTPDGVETSIGTLNFFDGMPGISGGMVEVSHGTYSERLPAGNMTVGEVRARFADRLDIHPEATAVIDGQDVGDDTVLRVGQTVNFVRPSGEKGGA